MVVPGGPVVGSVRPPGSKSLTNRALICAAFAEGASRLTGALVSEDTEVMIDSLAKIGVRIQTENAGRTLIVEGVGSSAASEQTGDSPHEMFIANSGTTVRFLTAALSAFGGRYRLSGVPRMHERPIGDLVEAIAPVMSGTIAAVSGGGCPPVEIESAGWTGEPMSVAGSVSSQYLSGLMMAAPISGKTVEIKIVGELVSIPYVRMTSELMRAFGGVTDWNLETTQSIRTGGRYVGTDYAIEPDASAASYFWAAAAITGGRIGVEGLSEDALQGDVGFVRVLEKMGSRLHLQADRIEVEANELRGVDVDMGEISDTVQTLSVVALFADSPTRVRGVAHNRFKETDRIGNLAIELRKLGARIDEHDDGLTIHPLTTGDLERLSESTDPIVFETYHDHRMAMSFALLGLRLPGIFVADPACTGKTYPEFWADLERLIDRPHHWFSQETNE
ncbi:3-phosphoshikimate 1-carboxyvinyltransferase [Neorhodopirellula pilleata]|nr:3-phosphoshikimate 1-carboxyvinyltransferase [Neorhodopirellula pilleata]